MSFSFLFRFLSFFLFHSMVHICVCMCVSFCSLPLSICVYLSLVLHFYRGFYVMNTQIVVPTCYITVSRQLKTMHRGMYAACILLVVVVDCVVDDWVENVYCKNKTRSNQKFKIVFCFLLLFHNFRRQYFVVSKSSIYGYLFIFWWTKIFTFTPPPLLCFVCVR